MPTISIRNVESIEVKQYGPDAWLHIFSDKDNVWLLCDYRLAERLEETFRDYHDWLSGQETGEIE